MSGQQLEWSCICEEATDGSFIPTHHGRRIISTLFPGISNVCKDLLWKLHILMTVRFCYCTSRARKPLSEKLLSYLSCCRLAETPAPCAPCAPCAPSARVQTGTLRNTRHLLSLCVDAVLPRRPLFFSVLAVMQWELSKVWSQSSLIRPKASDQTEGLILKACCQHKRADGSPLHLLGATPQPDHVYGTMGNIPMEQLGFQHQRERLSESAGKCRMPEFFRSADVTWGGQLPSRAWCSHSNQFTQTC